MPRMQAIVSCVGSNSLIIKTVIRVINERDGLKRRKPISDFGFYILHSNISVQWLYFKKKILSTGFINNNLKNNKNKYPSMFNPNIFLRLFHLAFYTRLARDISRLINSKTHAKQSIFAQISTTIIQTAFASAFHDE